MELQFALALLKVTSLKLIKLAWYSTLNDERPIRCEFHPIKILLKHQNRMA